MPPNSISLEFNKMPTVTVDGKTHKFKADKAGGYDQITVGGVTYSLVKDKASGRYTINITGEPAALEKYNFSVGKGRVTEGKFGGDSMEDFFKGSVSVGEKKKADKDYFQNFSIAGGHLANRTAFLQSGAWGLDANSAYTELERLEEEAKKAKEAEDAKKTSGTQGAGEQKPVVNKVVSPEKDAIKSKQTQENPITNKTGITQEPSVTATSNMALTQDEVGKLKEGVSEAHHDTIDRLVAKNDTASLRQIQSALETPTEGREAAHRILSDKANALYSNVLSPSELAQKTEANLAKLGLKANPTKGDGNCFFHAVADQGYWSQGSVRRQVADAMRDIMQRPANRDLPFPAGLGGKPPTQDQLDDTLLDASTAGPRAWGEDSHCAYVARAFDRPVVLIGPDNIRVYEKDKETDTISNASQLPKDAILLSHKGGNHWESASPIKP